MTSLMGNRASLPEIIRCVGMAEEVDRPERDDYYLQELILEDKVEIDRGVTVWWLDEEFKQHLARVEHGEPMLHFDIVKIPHREIIVKGIGRFEIRSR